MSGKRFRRSLSAIAISALFSVSMAGEAAIYSGRFDPVDFSGEYTITVPEACRLQGTGTGWYANDANCAVTLTSASARVISSAPEGPNYDGTLTFAPPAISSSSTLFGVYIVNNELDSFDTGLIPVVGGVPTTADGWWIEFLSGHMPPPCDSYCYGTTDSYDFAPAAFVATDGPYGPRGVNLYNSNFDGPIANADYTEVTRVPEPGTLPLLGGALLGAWLLRRRHAQGRQT